MADQITLAADVREETGKGVAGRLRRSGKVPGVIYGLDRDSRAVTVDSSDLYHALHTSAGFNVLIKLQAGDNIQLTMPKSVQRHPVRGDYMHIDFLRIDEKQKVSLEIPIHISGDEEIKVGIVSVVLNTLSVTCLPLATPDSIDIDVSGLEIGDVLRAGELTLPEGVELDMDPERTLITVSAPTVAEVEEDDDIDVDEFAGEGGDEAPAAEAAPDSE